MQPAFHKEHIRPWDRELNLMMEMNIAKGNERPSPQKAEQNRHLTGPSMCYLGKESDPVAWMLGPYPYTEGLCICPFDLSISLIDLLKIILFGGR